jgi:hypothetical protein
MPAANPTHVITVNKMVIAVSKIAGRSIDQSLQNVEPGARCDGCRQ